MASTILQKHYSRTVTGAAGVAIIKALIAVLPLLLGVLIYLLFRPGTVRVFQWLAFAGLQEPLALIRAYTMGLLPLVPEWLVYSLPNGLWAFSYSFIITDYWWKQANFLKYFWLLSVPAVGLGYEVMQFAGIIPGTFCYHDLLFCTAGITTGFLSAINLERRMHA